MNPSSTNERQAGTAKKFLKVENILIEAIKPELHSYTKQILDSRSYSDFVTPISQITDNRELWSYVEQGLLSSNELIWSNKSLILDGWALSPGKLE